MSATLNSDARVGSRRSRSFVFTSASVMRPPSRPFARHSLLIYTFPAMPAIAEQVGVEQSSLIHAHTLPHRPGRQAARGHEAAVAT